MSTKLIKISQFNYPTEIINLINGQELFKLRVNQKTFTTTDVSNGVKLNEPELVARINGQYVSKWFLKLSETPLPVRIFPPFGGADYKFVNKLLVSSGKFDETNVGLIKLALLSKALAIAVDFLLVAKLLDIDITPYKTDAEFFDAIKGKLGNGSSEALDEFLVECHSQELVFSEAEETPIGLIDIVRDNFKDYFKANPSVKTNKIYTFLGLAKQWISTKSTIKPIHKTLCKDGVETDFKTINCSLIFKIKTPTTKFENYCTKLVDKNKLITLDEKMMEKITDGKINANFVSSVEIDLRKYKTGLTNSIKFTISQFNYKPYEQQAAEIMLSAFDDEDIPADEDLITDFEGVDDYMN